MPNGRADTAGRPNAGSRQVAAYPYLRNSSHAKRKDVLANISSRHLRQLQKRMSSMNWPAFFDGGKVITRNWCDLVMSRLLTCGVSLRVANGGLHLVYDNPLELLLRGQLDVVETFLLVIMGFIESVVKWV